MPGGLFDTIDWALDCALETFALLACVVFLSKSSRRVSTTYARHQVIAVSLLACLIVPLINIAASASFLTNEQINLWLDSLAFPVGRQRFEDLIAGRMPGFYSVAMPFVVIWLAGAMVLLINQFWRLAIAELEARRLKTEVQKVSSKVLEKMASHYGVKQMPPACVVPDQGTACVQGLLSPVVIVPASFESLPEDE